jgi:hypothetical protein
MDCNLNSTYGYAEKNPAILISIGSSTASDTPKLELGAQIQVG